MDEGAIRVTGHDRPFGDDRKGEQLWGESKTTEADMPQVLTSLEQMDIGITATENSNEEEDNTSSKHRFWSTQPVLQFDDEPAIDSGPIELAVSLEQLQQHPYALPDGFEWSTIDLNDEKQCHELHGFLLENYVADDDDQFRFAYTVDFLVWALKPPGFHSSLHVGVRLSSSHALAAFISGVPFDLRVRKSVFPVAELNFLCVHKDHRLKRLTPALILEVTRRYRLLGVFQAVKTAGALLPTPVSTCRYYHRCINVTKLVDIGFTYIPRSMTLESLIEREALPAVTTVNGLREMRREDIPQVYSLMTTYLNRFDLVPIYNATDLEHILLGGRGREPRISRARQTDQFVWAYVVEAEGKITDFISFYSLPWSILDPSLGHSMLEAAYLFYYGTTSTEGDLLKNRLQELVGDLLVIAAQAGFDVFNALTLMDNGLFLDAHKFGKGNGLLHYYLYNWRTPELEGHIPVPPSAGGKGAGRGIGLVML